ncbi:hypothetical protein ACFCV3_00555 [Kribbella sp. NPDC056345]|uniref:hypothetical protein n=1 Tax=Kribbella sp. NPDC056345 TaxID=3345789 RepID=UPI0035D9FB0B
MNDTESRLRDYLDTKAATVPGTAQGPGLLTDTSPRRPIWPILATAASVAAVLALTVTVLTHVGADKAEPAGKPAPLTSDVPQVPFTIIDAKHNRTVYDGSQKVAAPPELHGFSARVDGGWIARYYKMSKSKTDPDVTDSSIGILQPDGKYRAVSTPWADTPVVSPDHKQIAFVGRAKRGDEKNNWLAVVDARTGTEVARVSLPDVTPVLSGWNRSGIWISSGGFNKSGLAVWRPGDSTVTRVRMPAGFGAIEVNPADDTIAFGTTTGAKRCLQAAAVRDGKLDVLQEYCDRGPVAIYPVLSTDGKTMLHSADNLAVDVATGKTTKLKLPHPIIVYPKPMFEDATKVLVVTQAAGNDANAQSLYRCDVTSGECKLVRTEKKGNQIVLAQP